MDFDSILANFDWVYVIMVLLGNEILFSIFPYGKLLKIKKMKLVLTLLQSFGIGIGYYYLNTMEVEPTSIKVLVNSFLLSSLVYEYGVKELFDFLKTKGSYLILNMFKSKLEK